MLGNENRYKNRIKIMRRRLVRVLYYSTQNLLRFESLKLSSKLIRVDEVGNATKTLFEQKNFR